jgi:hypothetical protein
MKQLLRCPTCDTTTIKVRKTRRPIYRCRRGDVFDAPRKQQVKCTKYVARYSAVVPPMRRIGAAEVKRLSTNRAAQLAIRRLQWSGVVALVREVLPDHWQRLTATNT